MSWHCATTNNGRNHKSHKKTEIVIDIQELRVFWHFNNQILLMAHMTYIRITFDILIILNYCCR
jgi:hypothetical protein